MRRNAINILVTFVSAIATYSAKFEISKVYYYCKHNRKGYITEGMEQKNNSKGLNSNSLEYNALL